MVCVQAPLRAQPAPEAPPDSIAALEGRPIREVLVRRLGDDGTPVPGSEGALTQEAQTLVRNTIRTNAGDAFSSARAKADISRLSLLGQFDIPSIQVTELADATVQVVFLVRLQPIIRDVQVVGNRALSDESIRDIIKPLVGTPQHKDQIKRYIEQVENAYKGEGYYGAQVSTDDRALRTQGVLIFRVREGRKTAIADVRFEGGLSFSPRELRNNLRATRLAIIEPNLVNQDDLTTDVATIANFYRDRGYFAVRVDSVVDRSPDGSEAIVTFVIDEGPVYTLRSVKIVWDEGEEQVLSEIQVLGLLSIKPGDVYGQRAVDKSVQTVRDACWTMGFADAVVTARELRDEKSPEIDLLLFMKPGDFYRTGEILLTGNETTQQKVARRHITFQPGRPLDRTQERETQRRLDNSRVFGPGETRITIQPPDPETPGFRDILVEVRETETGNFGMGGAVTSDGGVTAKINISEDNFDISKPPDSLGELFSGGFRGGGQVFNIEASPGDRAQRFSASLEEPSLFDSNYRGSVSAILNRRVYPQYNELRYGTNFALGRNFGSRWIGRVPVRIQWAELTSLDADAPVDYFNVADLSLLTSVAVSLSRTTLDNSIRPTKGSGTDFSIEQAGALGGEYDFTTFRAGHKVFIPINEDVLGRRTVLQIATRASYTPQGVDAVPVFERAYLGGQEFRGFDLRGIGPRGIRNDTGTLGDDPVGGSFSFFLGAEVQQPIIEDLVALAFFVDTGTVNTSASLANYRASAGMGFRVIIPGLSRIPLAFDFGFPLLKEDFDEERLFTFTVDVPF
jgi:outer membrane protein insertion porin family